MAQLILRWRPLEAVALTVKPLVVADRLGAVRSWRYDGANATLLEVVADRNGIIGLVGDEGSWRPLRQLDQRAVAFAVCRFARREVEGDRSPSGITETRRASMDIAVLRIDLGKNGCSVVGLDGSGKVILRRRMQRKTIVALTSKLSPCIIAMEACCGAQFSTASSRQRRNAMRLLGG
jgi:hypothetical protein